MAFGTLSPRQPRGWWESITTDDGLPPPEVLTYDEYTFKYLGMENDEERNGTVISGKSATTNLKSPGKLVLRYNFDVVLAIKINTCPKSKSIRSRSSWLNCALRDDEAVYWVSIRHYEAVAVGN